MLSDEETRRLLRAAKAGDAGAKEALLAGNVSLLKSIVRRYLGKGVEFDEANFMYDAKGKLVTAYLKDEIGGFAFHIRQRPAC